MVTMCDICGNNRATLHGRYGAVYKKRFCLDCREKPEYKVVSLTDAKRIYKLKKEELDELNRYVCELPTYGRCTYFLLRDVEEALEDRDI